ncbi:hypothetical protein ACFL2Q_07890 [Thermodesulfobacteriota bacterium]
MRLCIADVQCIVNRHRVRGWLGESMFGVHWKRRFRSFESFGFWGILFRRTIGFMAPSPLGGLVVLALSAAIFFAPAPSFAADDCYFESCPAWEPLLWGGKIRTSPEVPASDSEEGQDTDGETDSKPPVGAADDEAKNSTGDSDSEANAKPAVERPSVIESPISPVHTAQPCLASPPGLVSFPHPHCRDPLRALTVKNIPPLYRTPRLAGEGIWDWKEMPKADHGWPAVYRTSYRPSVDYPNAIVYMLMFDMKQLVMRLYVGSGEPGASKAVSKVERNRNPYLVAITNGLWKRRHSRGAGAIFNGKVLETMFPGMATLVVYKDGSLDILEWNNQIPLELVQDARQLRHLIVKDGRVVNTVVKQGREVDSEIGLGFLLAEDEPVFSNPWGGFYGQPALNHTSGPDWFIATRSAFGIRPDGNLVFAVGHHISTKDLAKALVLAGCVRGIHGDANPHNVLGNLYYTDPQGNIVEKAKLSPDQNTYTLQRYLNSSYTSDFFVFFRRSIEED